MDLSSIPIKLRKLGRQKFFGRISWDSEDKPQLIELDPRQSDQEFLDTLIHEYLHALFPETTEEGIIRLSNQLSKALWAQGYRKNT